MQNRSDELSQDMYHRIYRMIKRNIEPQLIAATLNISLKTINAIISRLKQRKNFDTLISTPDNHSVNDFLDAYLYTKTRYAVIQIVGALHKKHLYLLENELQKLVSSTWKAIALRLSDVNLIDKDCCSFISASYQKFQDLGRYLAILDPSPEIEAALNEFNMESIVPIFGTERAFEEAAFSKKTTFGKA